MYANSFLNIWNTPGDTTAEIIGMIHRYTANTRTNEYNSSMRHLAEKTMPLQSRAVLGDEHTMDCIDDAVGKPVELHARDGQDMRVYVVSNNGSLKVAEKLPGFDEIASIFYRPQKVYVPVKTTKLDRNDFTGYHRLQG